MPLNPVYHYATPQAAAAKHYLLDQTVVLMKNEIAAIEAYLDSFGLKPNGAGGVLQADPPKTELPKQTPTPPIQTTTQQQTLSEPQTIIDPVKEQKLKESGLGI